MKLQKRDSLTGEVVFAVDLPPEFDERTKFLEFHEHLLLVPVAGEPLCVDRKTCERIPLDSQKQIEARLVAAKVMGETRTH